MFLQQQIEFQQQADAKRAALPCLNSNNCIDTKKYQCNQGKARTRKHRKIPAEHSKTRIQRIFHLT